MTDLFNISFFVDMILVLLICVRDIMGELPFVASQTTISGGKSDDTKLTVLLFFAFSFSFAVALQMHLQSFFLVLGPMTREQRQVPAVY